MNARKIGQKRHQHDLDGFEYVMRMPGRSRSGRKVKPKVYHDGTVSLVGCVDESGTIGKPLEANIVVYGGMNTDSPKDTSAEDCQSPMGRDVHRRIIGETLPKKHLAGKNTGGGIFKAAAVSVLREEGRLMTTGEITKAALKRGFIKCSGKTPDATMASALYTDIKRRTGESIFVRPREGLFGLREWDGNHVAFSADGRKSEEYSCSDVSNKKDVMKAPALKKHGMHTEGLEAVGQTLGSTNGRVQAAQHASRDGLIDLLSAAERVNNNCVSYSPKRKRRVLITAVAGSNHTAVDRSRIGREVYKMPHMRSPRNRRKPQPDRTSNEGSVGEKGSAVCMKQEDNRGDVCVQSPRTNRFEDMKEFVLHTNMESGYLENDLKDQLKFLRYCVQNPNDITRVRAEETLLNIEEALLSHEQRMSADERLNNEWKPQEDEFIHDLCNDEKFEP